MRSKALMPLVGLSRLQKRKKKRKKKCSVGGPRLAVALDDYVIFSSTSCNHSKLQTFAVCCRPLSGFRFLRASRDRTQITRTSTNKCILEHQTSIILQLISDITIWKRNGDGTQATQRNI